jgi:hypothetical protein
MHAASGGDLLPAWNPKAPTVLHQAPAGGSAVQQMNGIAFVEMRWWSARYRIVYQIYNDEKIVKVIRMWT